MLYSEFIEGTGCRDNDQNYTLYRRLEIIYMNDDTVSKQDIYDMGKKLMDNSKSEKEIELENELNAQIASYKDRIDDAKRWVEHYTVMENKRMVKYYKDEIKTYRRMVKENRWILGKGEL